MNKTVLITGANRGIGLAFVKSFIAQGYTVYGTTRNLAKSGELVGTGATVIELDLSSDASIASLPQRFSGPLDLLINNAAIYIRAGTLETTGPQMHETFQTNTIAPLLIIQALLPNLKQASNPKVFNISSRIGSIADNSSGNSVAYRASKTALNMINKNLSIEVPEVIFVVLHPGHIQTEMTSNTGDMGPDEAVARMIKVIDGADKTASGKFYHRDGPELPW